MDIVANVAINASSFSRFTKSELIYPTQSPMTITVNAAGPQVTFPYHHHPHYRGCDKNVDDVIPRYKIPSGQRRKHYDHQNQRNQKAYLF
jgi:hypothetical protein